MKITHGVAEGLHSPECVLLGTPARGESGEQWEEAGCSQELLRSVKAVRLSVPPALVVRGPSVSTDFGCAGTCRGALKQRDPAWSTLVEGSPESQSCRLFPSCLSWAET